jgi:hypothetical protein
MGALTQKRMTRNETFRTKSLPLSAQSVFQGGMACYDTAALGALKKGASGVNTLVRIGNFAENADNTAAGAPFVNVRLDKELFAAWYDNATGGGAVVMATHGFGPCYISDDHTVTSTAGSNAIAGRVWDVDSVKGVLVEKITGLGTTV